MIKIKYCGRMGNSLLQYGFARILSEELGQYLPPHPITSFPNTYKDVNLDKKNDEKEKYLVLTRKNLWDIEKIKKLMFSYKNIFMKSSCANYNNFKNHKDKIRKDWFYVDNPYNKNKLHLINKFFIRTSGDFKPIEVNSIEKNDLMINVRLGEIVSGRHRNRLLTFDYFDAILKNKKWNRIFITSDSIQHEMLKPFDKYSPIYFFQSNYMETLNLIKLFNKIAISQSSYSWWAAYLSDAEEIYYPIVIQGPWRVCKESDQDLRVNEDRYIYVSQKHSKIMGRFDEVGDWS